MFVFNHICNINSKKNDDFIDWLTNNQKVYELDRSTPLTWYQESTRQVS